MEGKDTIKELFSEKLGSYEANVNPELWGKVASQLGTTTAVVSTGVSILTKWLIGLGVSAAAITTAVIVLNSSEVEDTKVVAETEVLSEQPEVEVEKGQAISEIQLPKEIEVVRGILDQENEVDETDTKVRVEENTFFRSEIDKADNIDSEPNQDNTEEAGSSTILKDLKDELLVNENIPEENIDRDTLVETAEAEFSVSQYTNVFSPNGDGTNDEFFLNIEGVKGFYLIVINDRGEAVFKTEDVNFRWDGRDLRSEPVPDGNYVYMLSGKDDGDNPIAQTKSLTIIRSR